LDQSISERNIENDFKVIGIFLHVKTWDHVDPFGQGSWMTRLDLMTCIYKHLPWTY
jgi:hypothetical protein